MQFRDWSAGETDEFFSPSRYWDEAQFPWTDVATVEITEAFDDDDREKPREFLLSEFVGCHGRFGATMLNRINERKNNYGYPL